MDTHIADKRLEDLHVDKITVQANDRKVEKYTIDAVAEKKLLRKIDWHLVPILWLLFLLSFLDRTNIGNARIQGMTEDLHQTGDDYNIALFMFFITYILFEVPSNIVIKKLRPSVWLSSIMVLWGIATVCQGVVKTNGQLIAMRLLIGLFEAGFFPGCIYLISMYYKRYELQWRINLFFSGSVLAGAFSGLLAYGIAQMSGTAGYKGWRWIFILEGILTVVCAASGFWLIPDWPESARFLNEQEKELLVARLSTDVADAKMNRLDRQAIKRIFSDWKIYCGIIMYLGIVNTGYATSFFTATILKELGYTSTGAQVHSIPIFVVAAVISLVVAWCTDRLRHRYAFCILGVCVSTIGYVILLCQSMVPVGARYFAIFVIVSGGYATQPVTLGWIQNNVAGHYKRSVASAMMVGFGNCGGLVASNIFIDSQAPGYPVGYGVSLAFSWMCAAACTALFLGVRAENRKRDRGERDWRLDGPDADNLGDDHPHFRFTY